MLITLIKTYLSIITNRRQSKFNTNDGNNNNSMVPSPIRIHPFKLCSKYNWDNKDSFDGCIKFLDNQVLFQKQCHSKLHLRELLHSCMSFCCCDNEFESHPLTMAAARYMVYFARMNCGLQQAIVVNWIHYSKHTTPTTHPNCVFLMPIMNSNDPLEVHDLEAFIIQPPWVCYTFIMNILNIGKCIGLHAMMLQ